MQSVSDLQKAIGSRSEHRHWIQKRMQEATFHFSEWKTERDFLDSTYNMEFKEYEKKYGKGNAEKYLSKKYSIVLSDVSKTYMVLVKRLREVWFLLKFYISKNDINKDEYDLKIKRLADIGTQPQLVEDIFNDLDRLFAKYVPIADEFDRSRRQY